MDITEVPSFGLGTKPPIFTPSKPSHLSETPVNQSYSSGAHSSLQTFHQVKYLAVRTFKEPPPHLTHTSFRSRQDSPRRRTAVAHILNLRG